MNTFKNSQLVFPDLFKPSEKPKPPARRSRLVFGTPRKPGNVLIFLVSFMTYLLGIFPSMLFALPSDPTVQAGSVDIHQHSPGSMVIHQSTDKAIIDWRAFGIGSNEHVDFQLQSSSGVTLNRVTGNERSDILGSMTSNGNLFLINPNGVLFGANSRVDVRGLVATTSDISNENFMAGNYNFDIPSSRGGIIVNRGTITVAEGGLVALVAPGVINEGIIEARLGRVTLASGNTFTLDLYGDQLINLGLNSQITEQVTGLDGDVLSSLISNSGAIYADGGRVRLTVNAARDVVDQVVNMSGIIQARSVSEQNGSIVLMGGDAGTVEVSGTLDVSGLNEDETGGTIHVFGDRINLVGSALLDASGYSGGGEILVGGDYQGKGDFFTASEVFVDRGVSIFNDALFSGDGGRSIFWADRRMRFFGSVYARGGRERGNGGFIEVSGKEELFFDGWADTSAENGLMGTLLLDPEDIIIADGSGPTSASGAFTFTISEQTLEALTEKTNFDLVATNSITLNNLSDNVLNMNISGSTFTMIAGAGGITFLDTNDKIQSSGGINLTATGGNLTIGSLETVNGNITLKGKDLFLNGTISSANGTTTLLSSNGGTIGLGATGGTFTIDSTELKAITAKNLVIGDGTNGNITVDGITAADSNNIAETVTLNATKSSSKVTFASASTFNALTVNAGNGIAANATVTTDAGDLVLNGGTGGITSTGAMNLTANQKLILNSSLNSTGDASLSAGTGITLANGIGVSSGGTLSLATTTGDINALGAVTVSSASGITLSDDFTSAGATTFDADSNNDGSGSFTVASGKTVTTGNNSLSITGADIVLTGSLDSGTGTTTLLSSNGGTIGLGVGAGTFSVTDSELGRITAGNLVIGDATNGDITVDGVTSSNNMVTLNATKSSSKVTFAGTSTFNALTVNAGSEIEANATVTTDAGDLVLNGGTGGITSTGAMNLDANQRLTLNSSLSSIGNANLSAGTGITLANGVNVSSGGTLSLATTTGDINALGAVTVNSASGITLSDDFTSAGATTFDADSNDDGSGNFTVASGKTVVTGNNSLSITGADIDLNSTGKLNSGTATTTLLASKSGTTIGLGVGAGTFSINGTELQNISAGNLVIGDSTNGDITVDGITAANSANITGTTTLNATKAGSKVSFNNNSTFGALNVNADDDVTVSGNLSTGDKSLSIRGKDLLLTGSLSSGTGTTTLLSSNDGTIGLGAGAGAFSVSGSELQKITAGNLIIGDNTNGNITVAGVTAANTVTIAGTTTLNATKSTSNVTFTTASSFGGPLSVNAGGNATVLTNDTLTLASSTVGGTLVVTVAGGNGLIVSGTQTAGGTISMTADSNITLAGGLFTSSASATAISLTTGGGILDGDTNGALDIDAANGGLVVSSVTGFGTSANAIETKVASVDITNTGLGEINFSESDGLNVVKIDHSGTGDINVTYFGILTGEANANAENGTVTFTNLDSGSLFLPEFGKTLGEVATDKTVSITNALRDNYFFGNQPSPTKGNTVAQMLTGPETGPFVTNVFDEDFELVRVVKATQRAHPGLRGFASFWGPLGSPNTELVKRPSRKSLREEAKLKKRGKKRRTGVKRRARPRLKNARVKAVGDTASLPRVQKQRQTQKRSKKPTQSWLASQLINFFK